MCCLPLRCRSSASSPTTRSGVPCPTLPQPHARSTSSLRLSCPLLVCCMPGFFFHAYTLTLPHVTWCAPANNERLLFASPPHLVGQHVVLPSNAIYRCEHPVPSQTPSFAVFLFVTPLLFLSQFPSARCCPRTSRPHSRATSAATASVLWSASTRSAATASSSSALRRSRPFRAPSASCRPSQVCRPLHSPLSPPTLHTRAHAHLWTVAKCVRFSVPENTFSSRVEYGADAVLPAEDAAAVRERRAALCAPVHEAQRRYSQQICVNVMDNSAFVVRLVLPRTVVAPGQVLHGVCDFRGGDVLCQALEVHVADEETVDPAVAYSKKVLRVGRDTYGAQSCNCSCLDLVPFAVELPAHATPEFATKYSLSPLACVSCVCVCVPVCLCVSRCFSRVLSRSSVAQVVPGVPLPHRPRPCPGRSGARHSPHHRLFVPGPRGRCPLSTTAACCSFLMSPSSCLFSSSSSFCLPPTQRVCVCHCCVHRDASNELLV